jgi:hypothetical protein
MLRRFLGHGRGKLLLKAACSSAVARAGCS